MTIQALARACANAVLNILDETTLGDLSEEAIQQARNDVLALIVAERATLAWPYDMEDSTRA